jgi:hypothetical protein
MLQIVQLCYDHNIIINACIVIRREVVEVGGFGRDAWAKVTRMEFVM